MKGLSQTPGREFSLEARGGHGLPAPKQTKKPPAKRMPRGASKEAFWFGILMAPSREGLVHEQGPDYSRRFREIQPSLWMNGLSLSRSVTQHVGVTARGEHLHIFR
jgi:hypothetical protein